MRLIDADVLKKKLQYVYSCDYIDSKSKEGIVSDIIDEIDNAPTVEERPQGEWVGINEYLKHLEEDNGEKYEVSSLYDGSVFCNNCWSMSKSKTCYCSACGADMREANNE